MKNFRDLAFQFINEKSLISNRRLELVSLMKAGEDNGRNCFSCVGFCCTQSHNSMQISPIEAAELYFFLVTNEMWDDELISKLNDNISEYRLDYELSVGGRSFRRTYTCPFFMHKSLGCPIAPTHKPYGCLAFNPDKKNVSSEGHCSSRVDLLENIERPHQDISSQFEESMKTHGLEFHFSKLPIPVALLEMDKILNN
tara:strand:+ start:377986 stop:378579 length:594 start_codon:yes stop_codon:yes gene_type:complete